MVKEINFDMDGTLVDFYGVDGWLSYLQNEDITPYSEARPLVNMSVLARLIHELQKQGWKINIISWTSKMGSANFNRQVTFAKYRWLRLHLPSVDFDDIYIIPYGTPKSSRGQGILFDDEIANCIEWLGGDNKAYSDPSCILATLRKLKNRGW